METGDNFDFRIYLKNCMDQNVNDGSVTSEVKSPLSGKKVLIIEDDALIGSILYNHLVKDGIDTTLLKTGEDGLQFIRETMPDVMLLDIFLPGINGLDLLESLRKDDKTKDLKILMLSNTDQLKDRTRAQENKAEFLVKAGVMPTDIVKKIGEMLGVSQ